MIPVNGHGDMVARTIPQILLITGAPGVGKTTALRKVAKNLGGAGTCGFYTEEMRDNGTRCGFRLVGFDGSRGIVAHVDFPYGQRVGKYGVDVEALDRLAGAALALRKDCRTYLVDEIGKMECLSPAFVAAMRAIINSGRPLVATVASSGKGFIREVKTLGGIELVVATPRNRDTLPTYVLEWIDRREVKAGPPRGSGVRRPGG